MLNAGPEKTKEMHTLHDQGPDESRPIRARVWASAPLQRLRLELEAEKGERSHLWTVLRSYCFHMLMIMAMLMATDPLLAGCSLAMRALLDLLSELEMFGDEAPPAVAGVRWTAPWWWVKEPSETWWNLHKRADLPPLGGSSCGWGLLSQRRRNLNSDWLRFS